MWQRVPRTRASPALLPALSQTLGGGGARGCACDEPPGRGLHARIAPWRKPAATLLTLCLVAWGGTSALGASEPDSPGAAEEPVAALSPPASRQAGLRKGDELWLVSSRLQCDLPAAGQPVTWAVWRWNEQTWYASDLRKLHEAVAAQPRPMLVFIHGNRVDAALAGQYGYQTYQALVAQQTDLPPVRFVAWSWPSDQLHGPIRDARTKADRSDLDAYFLAAFLAELPWPPDGRPTVGLLGYSLGARVACGSAHLLGGGRWLARELSQPPRLSLRLAVWAAAEHSHWLLPGQPHERALGAVDRCWVAVNPCDPVLSRYRWVDRCERPAALGVVGICGCPPLPADLAARVAEENVAGQIGKLHTLHPYLRSGYILEKTRGCLLGKVPPAASTNGPDGLAQPSQ